MWYFYFYVSLFLFILCYQPIILSNICLFVGSNRRRNQIQISKLRERVHTTKKRQTHMNEQLIQWFWQIRMKNKQFIVSIFITKPERENEIYFECLGFSKGHFEFR